MSDGGRILVYYVARKIGGPLCVAAATATDAAGPYIDHGPILCQPDGSIDPSFVRDEHGTPYLVWKEDGNSIHQPTPIWAQPLTPDLLHLTGDKTQLIVNDADTWEGGVVEAPYIMRHGDYFYLFYAGNSCCGVHCNYAEGVARAEHLTGPWQKDPANPIIHANDEWRCPGHGTAVQTATGDTYFIYHAYPALGTIFVGRESLMDPITWSSDGWPIVNAGKGPSGQPTSVTSSAFEDNFDETQLSAGWRWPIGYDPIFHLGGGHLVLDASPGGSPVFLARSLLTPNFISTVAVGDSTASAGLGVIGDVRTKLVLARAGNLLTLTHTTSKSKEVIWSTAVEPTKTVWLRVLSAGDPDVTFSYSVDDVHWTDVPPPQGLAHLPPWDQGLHVGLVVDGPSGTQADFSDFTLSASSKS